MRRRGRPPYPDILTPREWEVLVLLREGLSNEEIAQQLGISLAGAKYHVSEILGKLAVSSREEAARWQPTARPWWASALAPVALFWRKASFSWLAPAAAAGAAVVVAAGVGLLVWGLLRTGGGEGGEPTSVAGLPSPTATVEPVPTDELPFEVLGPLDESEALTEENLDVFSVYVLDLETRQFYVIKSPPPPFRGEAIGVQSARWLDDETLLVETRPYISAPVSPFGTPTPLPDPTAYQVRLGGEVVLPAPIATPTPVPQDVLLSPDGAWTATVEEDIFGALLVGPAGEDATFRLTNAWSRVWIYWPPAWAPTGHLLAFTGNICLGFDLFLFDPAEQALRNLTASLEPAALGFAWRPDSSALAVTVIPFGERDRGAVLGLVDAASGSIETLAEISRFGWLEPREWSPSGRRLLFTYVGGGGFCAGVGESGIPTPPPTTLELLSN